MHRIVQTIGILLSIAIVGFWFFGCSDLDPLDENRYRYSVSLTPQNGDDDTDDIDVVRTDCNGTAEAMGDFNAKVRIVAGIDVPDLRVLSYRVEFSPVRGRYWTDLSVDPPTLAYFTPPVLSFPLSNFEFQLDSPKVMEGGTLEFEIRIWSEGMKDYYVYEVLIDQAGLDQIVPLPAPIVSTLTQAEASTSEYDFNVIFECTDSEGNEFELEAYGSVDMADYDNC